MSGDAIQNDVLRVLDALKGVRRAEIGRVKGYWVGHLIRLDVKMPEERATEIEDPFGKVGGLSDSSSPDPVWGGVTWP